MTLPTIEKKIRGDLPQVGVQPFRQVHAHSTGNPGSTAQNEADYMYRKDINSGFYTHVVGNGRIIQVAPVNNGAWDVGGGWNAEGYASVELIESHKTRDEFMTDYRIYVDLLRQLAKEAGIPTTLDTMALEGIKSHEHCTNNQPNNFSDHVDPYPYLSKWGISKAQFRKDLENGFGSSNSKPTQKPQPQINNQEDINMLIIKSKDGNGTVYFHDGNKVISLNSAESLKSLKSAGVKEVTMLQKEIEKMR